MKSEFNETNALSRYLNEATKTPLLTAKEEHQLAERIMNGDLEARNRMVETHLRLVPRIAEDYKGMGLDVEDLIQAGNIGLIIATKKIDPNKNLVNATINSNTEKHAQFSSYAEHWIRKYMRIALNNQSRTIRVPANTLEKIRLLGKIETHISNQLSHPATIEDIAEETGIEETRINILFSHAQTPISIEAAFSDEIQRTLNGTSPEESADNPGDKAIIIKETFNNVGLLLDQLTERQRFVLNQRFGLTGEEPKTLEQVGQQCGITRERVRQIQNDALNKIRNWINENGTLDIEDLYSSCSP